MQWIALIVTALILAAVGRIVVNLHAMGHWWIWVLLWTVILVGIYRLGEDEDREYFHRAWRWITRTLRLR